MQPAALARKMRPIAMEVLMKSSCGFLLDF
jgi:hypothetical protein